MSETPHVLIPNGGINSNIEAASYAVRGELVLKALEYDKMLKDGKKLPFEDIIYCNIGNPQSLGNPHITHIRHVLALITAPEILESENVSKVYPKDAIARAKLIVEKMGKGGVGSYSHSQGIPLFRQWVADFIEKRDGFPANPDHIFLTDGASPGVKTALNLLIRNDNDGIMIPLPQYPLYSATVELLGGKMVGYYLDEATGWSLSVAELRRSINKARKEGTVVRALCVINPGNPTSQCLPADNMKEVVKFCAEEKLVLLADEVYQENVYSGQFTSFKKIVRELDSNIELMSFHSVSKGMMGECGLRGGYTELTNVHDYCAQQWYKLASISLCPNTIGQATVGLMVKLPDANEHPEAYEQYMREKTALYESYERRSRVIATTLNSLDGISCQLPEGAMYAFPTIELPKKAIEAAKKAGKQPDTYYCLRLLEASGICVVPGCGFGQVEGTFHFRTTFLPPEDKIQQVADRLKAFHVSFMAEYKE